MPKTAVFSTSEIIPVPNDADGVSCDGGGGALGHPKVWYGFDGGTAVECSYCDRLFVKEHALGRYDGGS
ncbi:MAG: zinc-finger domain-containing protein [Rhodospirillales bacterium]|nr:zinc-finger domain-containing protein [Rhodospirillales bacterium]